MPAVSRPARPHQFRNAIDVIRLGEYGYAEEKKLNRSIRLKNWFLSFFQNIRGLQGLIYRTGYPASFLIYRQKLCKFPAGNILNRGVHFSREPGRENTRG
jgi:hypothetical protein